MIGHEFSYAGPGRRGARSAAVPLFLFLFMFFGLTMQGVQMGGDALGMYLAAESLATRGSVFVRQDSRVVLKQGRGGQWVSKYGIGQSLAETPWYLIGDVWARRDESMPDDAARYFVVSLAGPAVSAAICVFLYFIAIEMGATGAWALGIALVGGLGTMVWPYARTLFSEPLTGLCLTGAFYWHLVWRRRGGLAAAAGAAFMTGLAVAVKPMVAFCVLPFIVYFFVAAWRAKSDRRRRAQAAVYVVVGFAWLVVVLWYNWARFGDVMQTGYYLGRDFDSFHKFDTPLYAGIHGLLASPGKGVFFYVPVLALSVAAWRRFAREWRGEVVVIGAVAAAFVVMFAGWYCWHGDFAWGPRFLMPVVPLMMVPLVSLWRGEKVGQWRRLVFAAVVGLSVFVQALGSLVSYNEYIMLTIGQPPYQVLHYPGRLELRDQIVNNHYIPEFSPIAGHWWLLRHTAGARGESRDDVNDAMRQDFPWKSLMPYAAPPDPARAVGWDCWWRYVPMLYPASAGWVKTLAACMAVAAVACLVWLIAVWRALALRGRGEETSL